MFPHTFTCNKLLSVEEEWVGFYLIEIFKGGVFFPFPSGDQVEAESLTKKVTLICQQKLRFVLDYFLYHL